MCSSTSKYITIENDFIRQLATKRPNRLKLKWSLSKVSDFPGQDQRLRASACSSYPGKCSIKNKFFRINHPPQDSFSQLNLGRVYHCILTQEHLFFFPEIFFLFGQIGHVI